MVKYFIFRISNKFLLKKIKYSKKSMMALEALIGTILSIIALFMIFQVFSSTFLQTPENLKIAETNAQDIVNFVDYSNNKYKELGLTQNCEFMLKLKNIENFQLNSNKDKYFYLIDNNKVYVLKWKDLPNVINKKLDFSYLSNSVKSYNFKNDKVINLKKDITTQSLMSINFEFWTFGGSDKIIKFENASTKLLLLVPQFKIVDSNYLTGKLGSLLNSNQNNLLGEVLHLKENSPGSVPDAMDCNLWKQQYSNDKKNLKNAKSDVLKNDINYNISRDLSYLNKYCNFKNNDPTYYIYDYEEGNYLIYEPETNNLFLSHSYLTNTFAKNNLCYSYEINKNNMADKNTILINSGQYDKLDEINNNIIMSCLIDNKPLSGTFEWDSGPICKGNSDFCSGFNNILNDKLNLKNIKYVDFLKKLKDNCEKQQGLEVKFSLKAVSKTVKDRKSTPDKNIDFNKIFHKISLSQNFKDLKNSKNLIKLNYPSTKSCNVPSIGCDYIYLIGNEVSFFYNYKQQYFTHDKEFTNFLYTININYLRKTYNNGKLKIYFNNKEIKLDKPIVYNLKKGFFNFLKPNDVKIYKGLIQLRGDNTIYLTQTQVNNIPLQN